MKTVLLAIDIGTTNVKCVVAEPNMRFLSSAESEYATISLGNAWFEQDPLDWWERCKRAVGSALEKACCLPEQVRAVAVSSQAPTMLPVDRQGRPVRNALIWMDRRSNEQCRRMDRELGPELVYQTTGNTTDPFYTFSELLWMQQNEPEHFERTHRVLQANGYINFRLTGEYSIDLAHATITQCFDVEKLDWCDAMLERFGVSRSLFPRVVQPHEVIGGVSPAAARETGLRAGTPVLGGTVDGAAAALEGGLYADGTAVEMSGTSSVLLVGSAYRHSSPCLTYMHSAIPGQHLLLGCMSTSGGALKWYRDAVSDDKSPEAYRHMDEEIVRDCPHPARVVFLPYLAGERAPIWNTQAKGAFMGITSDTTRGELYRAMEEGACFALLDNLTEARRAGAQVKTLRTVGSATRSDIWMKIKASILDMPLEVPRANFGAPGGLLTILACAAGEYASVEEAVRELVVIDRVVEPERAWTAAYQEQFAVFKSLYEHTKEDFIRLDGIRRNGI